MRPVSIDLLDGGTATIDPTTDPTGYGMALHQRAWNRNINARLHGQVVPFGPIGHLDTDAFLEAFGVGEENDPKGRRWVLDPSGFGFADQNFGRHPEWWMAGGSDAPGEGRLPMGGLVPPGYAPDALPRSLQGLFEASNRARFRSR